MRNCLDLTMPVFMQSATGLKHIELIRLDLAFRGVSLFIAVWHCLWFAIHSILPAHRIASILLVFDNL